MMLKMPLLALIGLALPATVWSGDWPQFLGPYQTGVSRETGIRKNWNAKPPAMVWQVPLTDNGFAGPSVANGLLYIVDHVEKQDVVRALDARTGAEKWRYAYDEPVDDQFGWARATPTVSKGRVYTISRMGTAHCLEAASGKVIWKADTIGPFEGKVPQWFVAASILVDENQVIVFPGGKDSTVAALDARTGKTLWTGGGTGYTGYSTAVLTSIGGQKQYVVWAMDRLLGIRPSDGATLWTYRYPACASIATPVMVGESVFITSGYEKGCALVDVKGDKGVARYESKDIQAHVSTPILINGYLYGNSDPGNLVCMEAATGKTMWKERGFEKGPVFYIDGVLLAMNGSNGLLRMVKPSPTGYQEIGAFTPLGGQSWTAPIVANGLLYVRNKKTLACFSLR